MENEYIFDVTRLPKTRGQADLMAKQFEEDARRWYEYEDYDDEEEEEDDEVMVVGSENNKI